MRVQKIWADCKDGEAVFFGDKTDAIWTKRGMWAHFAGSSKYVEGGRRVYEADIESVRPAMTSAPAMPKRAEAVKPKKTGLLASLGSMFQK
jgi:hypothetical protein